MEIRPATKNDYFSIAEMLAPVLGEALTSNGLMDGIYFDEDFDPNLVLVAREGGKTLGYAASLVKERKGVKTGFLKLIAVSRARQGSGLGRQILERVEERLGDEGADSLLIDACPPSYFFPGVPEKFRSALSFFEKMGYEICGHSERIWVLSAAAWEDRKEHQAGAKDFQAALELVKTCSSEWCSAVEEAFSYSTPRAVKHELSSPRGGLCLYVPGLRVGPLFSAAPQENIGLMRAAFAAASSVPVEDPRGLLFFGNEKETWWKSHFLINQSERCFCFRKQLA